MGVPVVKENGLFLLSAGLLLEITRRKVCVLSIILFSTAVVKSHQRATFILLLDVHLGKKNTNHLSCCWKVGILRDAQREMLEFPLKPHAWPTAFQGMPLPAKNKAGSAGAQLLMCCSLWMCSLTCQVDHRALALPQQELWPPQK